MKLIRILSIPVVAILCVSTSCTIEKRVHLKGYHVKWKNPKLRSSSEDQSDQNPVKIIIAEEETISQEIPAGEFVASENSVIAENSKTENFVFASETQTDSPSLQREQPGAKKAVSENTAARPLLPEEKETVKQIEPLGLAGFIIGIIGWFVPAFGLAALMCLLAFIFGAISLGNINKKPDRLKGKGFAITSIVVGIVGLILAVALLSAL